MDVLGAVRRNARLEGADTHLEAHEGGELDCEGGVDAAPVQVAHDGHLGEGYGYG